MDSILIELNSQRQIRPHLLRYLPSNKSVQETDNKYTIHTTKPPFYFSSSSSATATSHKAVLQPWEDIQARIYPLEQFLHRNQEKKKEKVPGTK